MSVVAVSGSLCSRGRLRRLGPGREFEPDDEVAALAGDVREEFIVVLVAVCDPQNIVATSMGGQRLVIVPPRIGHVSDDQQVLDERAGA